MNPLQTSHTLDRTTAQTSRKFHDDCKRLLTLEPPCTCRAKLLEGRVAMAANYSLEPWETEAGYVLTCQAHPTTARVVVDFDQV